MKISLTGATRLTHRVRRLHAVARTESHHEPDAEYAAIVEYLKEHTAEVVVEWERLVGRHSSACPWTAPLAETLPELIMKLAVVSLSMPTSVAAHRRLMVAAAEHGYRRRLHDVPEHLIPEEYHLLQQALRTLLEARFRHSGAHAALGELGSTITLAINGSMWGYYRPEIQALGRWDRGMERLISLSPFLRRGHSEGC